MRNSIYSKLLDFAELVEFVFVWKVWQRLWSYEKNQNIEVWRRLRWVIKKTIHADNPGQSIWCKVKKSSKIYRSIILLYLLLHNFWLILHNIYFWRALSPLIFTIFSMSDNFLRFCHKSFGNSDSIVFILNIKHHFT